MSLNASSETKKDLLNRESFVSSMVNIAKQVSMDNESCAFAIDGAWGSGKTFVLDMFQNKLKEEIMENGINRFLVFPYDCWTIILT